MLAGVMPLGYQGAFMEGENTKLKLDRVKRYVHQHRCRSRISTFSGLSIRVRVLGCLRGFWFYSVRLG